MVGHGRVDYRAQQTTNIRQQFTAVWMSVIIVVVFFFFFNDLLFRYFFLCILLFVFTFVLNFSLDFIAQFGAYWIELAYVNCNNRKIANVNIGKNWTGWKRAWQSIANNNKLKKIKTDCISKSTNDWHIHTRGFSKRDSWPFCKVPLSFSQPHNQLNQLAYNRTWSFDSSKYQYCLPSTLHSTHINSSKLNGVFGFGKSSCIAASTSITSFLPQRWTQTNGKHVPFHLLKRKKNAECKKIRSRGKQQQTSISSSA